MLLPPPWGRILENLRLSFPRRGPYRPLCSVSSVPREPATAPGKCGFSAVGAGDPWVSSSRVSLWLTSCHEDGAPSGPLDLLGSHVRPASLLRVLPERSGFLLQHPAELGKPAAPGSPSHQGRACRLLAQPLQYHLWGGWHWRSPSYHVRRIPIPGTCCSLPLGPPGPTRPPLSVCVCPSKGALPGFPASSEGAGRFPGSGWVCGLRRPVCLLLDAQLGDAPPRSFGVWNCILEALLFMDGCLLSV